MTQDHIAMAVNDLVVDLSDLTTAFDLDPQARKLICGERLDLSLASAQLVRLLKKIEAEAPVLQAAE